MKQNINFQICTQELILKEPKVCRAHDGCFSWTGVSSAVLLSCLGL